MHIAPNFTQYALHYFAPITICMKSRALLFPVTAHS